MTDKQIIIDGVNVKDCRRRIGKDNYCRYFKRLCSDNNFNCVWKQLARKTQEYEQLKEKYEGLKLETEEAYEIVAALEIDNQECWDIAFLKDENTRYRKALDEIDGVIKNLEKQDILTFPDFPLQENYKVIMKQCNRGYIDILDIINKTKDGNNDR